LSIQDIQIKKVSLRHTRVNDIMCFQQGNPVGLKEVFNYAHSSLRNVIERCFRILKNKWRILEHLPSYPIHKQAQIIVACMPLHNFIRDSALYNYDFENYEDEFPKDFHDEASI
jgi:hypothetical protein